MISTHSKKQDFFALYCDAYNLIIGHFRDHFIHSSQGFDDAIAPVIVYSLKLSTG